MKRLFILSLLLAATVGYSQTQTIEPGTYKANVKGQKMLLRVFEDNRYEIALFYGKFNVENDTINFSSRDENDSAFLIKVNKDAAFSSSLKIKVKAASMMFVGSNIFIGTQKDDNAVIEYKALSDYVNKRAYSYGDKLKDLKIDVEKTKYLYFVDANNRGNSTISKFQIDPSVNEVELEYDGRSLLNFELKGVVNPETKKISIMEGRTRKDILEFEKFDAGKEGEGKEKDDHLKALQVLAEKDWRKKNGFVEEDEFDSSYLERRQKNSKTSFKHTIAKSYNEALKNIEKTPEKFLVVAVDDSKAAQKEFDNFIKDNEESTARVMYNGYDAKKDPFNFYLAGPKDKSTIAKFNIKDKTALLFLNSKGELVYHTDGTLEENSNLFQTYYSVYEEVRRANEHLKFDKLINNKKTPLAEIRQSLFDIIKTKNNNHYPADYVTDSVAVETVVEDAYPVDMAVDTAAAVAYDGDEYESDYYQVKDPENLYSLKTPKEVVAAKWKAIVDATVAKNAYDADFIEMAKKELLFTGFTKRMFGGQKMVTDTDFKILDYIFRNYDEILKNESKRNQVQANEYVDPYGVEAGVRYTQAGIDATLSTFFQKMSDEQAHLHRSSQMKLLEYYKNYLKKTGFKLADFNAYLDRIKDSNSNDYSLLYKEFGEYYDTLLAKGPSLLETLDGQFDDQKAIYSWADYKHTFSMIANNIAWLVVETNNNDANAIRTAIKWTEASLKVTKNEYHYLDTLAQLYYKNNEKEKGIATEQQAIDNLPPGDKERIKSYNEILESMKNGTY